MTENSIELIGFDLVKTYHHDSWYTSRYEKGIIQIEFTYLSETDEIVTIDMTIDEVVGKKINLKDLKILDNLLND